MEILVLNDDHKDFSVWYLKSSRGVNLLSLFSTLSSSLPIKEVHISKRRQWNRGSEKRRFSRDLEIKQSLHQTWWISLELIRRLFYVSSQKRGDDDDDHFERFGSWWDAALFSFISCDFHKSWEREERKSSSMGFGNFHSLDSPSLLFFSASLSLFSYPPYAASHQISLLNA